MTTADAFAILAELNPQLKEQLHVIATSPPLVLFMVCSPKSLDHSTRTQLTEQLLGLHKNQAGKQMLLINKATALAPVTPTQLATIKALSEDAAIRNKIQAKQLTHRDATEP